MAESEPEVCGFRLYVERDNERAQRTYRSLGMSRTPYLVYEAATRRQEGEDRS
jgi:ribosomal protein S18 acetylase RimI-like enzyme